MDNWWSDLAIIVLVAMFSWFVKNRYDFIKRGGHNE